MYDKHEFLYTFLTSTVLLCLCCSSNVERRQTIIAVSNIFINYKHIFLTQYKTRAHPTHTILFGYLIDCLGRLHKVYSLQLYLLHFLVILFFISFHHTSAYTPFLWSVVDKCNTIQLKGTCVIFVITRFVCIACI